MKIYLPIIGSLLFLFTGILTIIYGKERGVDVPDSFKEKVHSLDARLDTIINQQSRIQAGVNSTVIQPIRQGFPYCEPFTGVSLEREKTEVRGSAQLTAINANDDSGVLRLTKVIEQPPPPLPPIPTSQLGYAFVDLPFSSTYGIKVSFEYFIYNPDPSEDAGDGISFFLYDGGISATDFKIGGLGGSLGYSPHGYSTGGYTGDQITGEGFGGLLGGYLGVGFDVFGRFGSEYERRFGGFLNPIDFYPKSPAGWADFRYPHGIVVRGPQVQNVNEYRRNGMDPDFSIYNPTVYNYIPPFSSYRFIEGKITYVDTADPIANNVNALPPDAFVSPMFKLSSQGPVNCSQTGYRKVFIDFRPVNPSDPNTEYQIKVDMLINDGGAPQLITNVINTQFDPGQTAPETFKLGFAGATGSKEAFQEIRNVTAQVSNEGDLEKPRTELLHERICIDEVEFFELDVDLSNNEGATIQCIQLYADKDEADAVQEELDNIVGVQDCESGICLLELCKQERLREASSIGEFEAFIFLENGEEVPKIQFTSNGTPGSATIWYTVTDNFGQISEPKPITITIDPLPAHRNPGNERIDYPSCDGQEDGTISNVIFEGVVNGFTPNVSWVPEGTSTSVDVTSDLTFTPATNEETTLTLANVNLGTYTFIVTNPAGCSEEAIVVVDQELGTPVDALVDSPVICEGGEVNISPSVDQEDLDNAGRSPEFLWYSDSLRNNPLQNGDSEVFLGNQSYPAEVTISPSGVLTINGLQADGTNSQKYNFYVEVQDFENTNGANFCALEVGKLTPARVTVTPGITFGAISVSKEDWCLLGEGEIVINDLGGGDGTFKVDLLKENGDPVDSKTVTGTSASFSNLRRGKYFVRITSGTPPCITPDIEIDIQGPDDPLSISIIDQTDPTCELENGEIQFEVYGGTPPYTFTLNGGAFSPTASAGIYTISGLGEAPTYIVEVIDANSCNATINSTALNAIPVPVFAVTTAQICPEETATITVDDSGKSNATNIVYTWTHTNGDPLVDANGVTYTQNSTTGELTISGLTEDQLYYDYELQVSGTDVCTQVPITGRVNITPTPVVDSPDIDDVSCFGGSDGTITLTATDPATASDYEYSIDGGTNFQNNSTFTGLIAGTYTVRVRSKIGSQCFKDIPDLVVGEATQITTNTPDTSRASCGLPTGSIDNLQISGGSGTYSIEWRRGSQTGDIVPGDLNGAQNLYSDTYYAIVKNQAGAACPTIFDFLVEEQPAPNYQVTQAMDECAGVPVIFTPVNIVSGSSPTEVKWYKGPGQTNEIVTGPDGADPDIVYTIDDSDWVNPTLEINGLPAGTYTYYFYVVCTGQEIAVDVEIFPIPDVELDSSPETCFNAEDGKIYITSGGSSSQVYFVDGGSGLTQSELENLTFAPKVYDIRVEQAGVGCPANFQVEVLGPDAALSIAPLTAIDPGCGADIGIIRSNITGGWAPYEVTLFKDGVELSTQNISGSAYEAVDLAPGDYYLRVEDAEGCVENSNTVTLVYGPTQVLVDDIEICESEPAVLKPTLNPVAPGATFEWYKGPGATNPISSNSTPDANGHTFDIAADGTLTVSGLKSTDSPVQYYVRATGGGICPGGFAKPTVGIFDQPTVAGVTQNEVCFGDKGSIILTGAGGSGTYEYSLDGSTFQSSNVFDVDPGTYVATVRSGGCENVSSPIIVTGPPAPITNTAPVISDPTCGQANGVIQFTISGGYGSYSVESFKDGTSLGTPVPTSGDFELTNLLAGDYTFIIIDGGGCSFTIDNPITLVDGLTPLAAPDQEICEGEVASITPSSSQIGITPTFTWYQNSDGTGQISNGTIDGVTYQVNSDGTLTVAGLEDSDTPYKYYVEISGPGTCPPPLKEVDVMVYAIPNLRVSNPSIVCDPNGTVDLTEYIEGFNSSIYDYQIESPSGADMRLDEIQSVDESGSYVIQSSLKGANCWTPTQRILVKITDTELIPEFNYQFDLGGGNILVNSDVQILEPVDFLDISQGDVVIWNWDFGDGGSSSEQNPTHTYDSKGIFTVTLTTIDEIGCVGTYQRVIEVRDDYLIMVPNAFTPTGTKNLYFKPQFRGIASMEFYVFNTWGELIFESNSLETLGWDGTWKGKDTPNGNYVYKAIFTTRSGQKVEKAGVFILIR